MSRFYPVHPVHRLRNEMDRVFSNLFGEATALRESGEGYFSAGFPALNLWEDENAFHVEAEVPGLTLENLELQVKGSELTIAGERTFPSAENVSLHRRERATGRFERLVRLPADVDVEAVEAKLVNGVLTIKAPKSKAARPRKIEVTAN